MKTLAGIGVAVVLCLGAFFAKAWLFQSDIFRLTKVEIQGNLHTNQDIILKMSNLRAGLNLLSLNLEQVGRDIEALDWIRTVKVTKEFPDKLYIKVEEYRPVALVSGKGLYLVDAHGEIFRRVEKKEKWDLPIITGVSEKDIDAGRLPEEAMPALRLIDLAANGARTLGASNISEIHVKDKRIVVYTLNQGIALNMNPLDLDRQFARAEKVLLHLYRSGLYKKVAMVDLDYAPGEAWATLR